MTVSFYHGAGRLSELFGADQVDERVSFEFGFEAPRVSALFGPEALNVSGQSGFEQASASFAFGFEAPQMYFLFGPEALNVFGRSDFETARGAVRFGFAAPLQRRGCRHSGATHPLRAASVHARAPAPDRGTTVRSGRV